MGRQQRRIVLQSTWLKRELKIWLLGVSLGGLFPKREPLLKSGKSTKDNIFRSDGTLHSAFQNFVISYQRHND